MNAILIVSLVGFGFFTVYWILSRQSEKETAKFLEKFEEPAYLTGEAAKLAVEQLISSGGRDEFGIESGEVNVSKLAKEPWKDVPVEIRELFSRIKEFRWAEGEGHLGGEIRTAQEFLKSRYKRFERTLVGEANKALILGACDADIFFVFPNSPQIHTYDLFLDKYYADELSANIYDFLASCAELTQE